MTNIMLGSVLCNFITFNIVILCDIQYNASKGNAMEDNSTLDNVILELRRGVVVLAVLNQLQKEEYGYSILKSLSEQGLEIDQGTLYPLLRRLESQGLLQSKWRVEGDRPRRYYVTSLLGSNMLVRLKDEWLKLVDTMNRMM